MMRPLSWPLLGVVALSLSGCSNQYFERKDSVTFSAGDAVAWNNAQMIPDPTPRSAYNTNIVTPGETAARAGSDYAQGRFKWFVNPDNPDEPNEIINSKGASSPDISNRGQGGGTPQVMINNNSPAGGQ